MKPLDELGARDESLDRRLLVAPPAVQPKWKQLVRRRQRRVRLRRTLFAAGAIAAVAAALMLALRPSTELWVGTTLASTHSPIRAALEEGSEVSLEPHSRAERLVETEREVQIELSEGSASFDVVRNPARSFVVLADGVEVRVVGTVFEVSYEPVRVRVIRGAVDVRDGGQVHRVVAGDTWERPRIAESEANEAETPSAQALVTEADGMETGGTEAAEAHETEARIAEPRVAEPRVVEPRVEPRGIEGREEALNGEAREEAPDPEREIDLSAELFVAARGARRAGSPQRAATLYIEFLSAHPHHPNAGLVAFELGRLQMDVLGAPSAAASSFQRALRLGTGGFRQDGMARLVEALDAAGRMGECLRAQERYLARYPAGRHVQLVRASCRE